MKLGHNTRLQLPIHERPAVRCVHVPLVDRTSTHSSYRRFRSWQLGVVLFGLGNVANFVSFGFAAQSLLAALGSIQFVSNVLFGWLVLHEQVCFMPTMLSCRHRFVSLPTMLSYRHRFVEFPPCCHTDIVLLHYPPCSHTFHQVTRQILTATTLIIGGCVTLMVYGNHESPVLSVAQLLSLYHRPAYIAYLTLLAACALSAFLLYQVGRTRAECVTSIDSSTSHCFHTCRRQGLAFSQLTGRWARVLPLSYAAYSGMLGTHV